MIAGKFKRQRLGTLRFQVSVQGVSEFLGVLIRNEPAGNFDRCLGRNDGLGAGTGLAAEQTIHFTRGSGPSSFICREAGFT